MATIALKVGTEKAGTKDLPGGHAYVVFPEPAITIRELISEKVRAELRKSRAGGPLVTSLPLLLPEGKETGNAPLDEQLAIAQATRGFLTGHYLLLIDGKPMVELDEVVLLTRRTGIVFLCGNREAMMI